MRTRIAISALVLFALGLAALAIVVALQSPAPADPRLAPVAVHETTTKASSVPPATTAPAPPSTTVPPTTAPPPPPTTTTTAPYVPPVTSPPTTAPPAPSYSSGAPGVGDWQRVADCETGGDWSMQGSTYSGGLGIANSSWLAYGGGQYAPNAGLATPEEQVAIANAISGGVVPDANGCASW